MPAQFTMLASGSRGNCAFIDTGASGCLIDCGLSPKAINERLAAAGRSWPSISAVILTHTHSDHWNRNVFTHLVRYRIPLFVHAIHHEALLESSPEYEKLHHANLTRSFEDARAFRVGEAIRVLPWRVPHDSHPTFAFRIDGPDADNGLWWSIGYAADLGAPPPELFRVFHDVDILAWEFNHDVPMQRNSGRSQHLISRVLGPTGHLSNEQAANWLHEHLQQRETALHAVVQLHLSRDCNTPALAKAAAAAVLANRPTVRLITASQDIPTRPLPLVGTRPEPGLPAATLAKRIVHQRRLPGLT